MTNSTDHAPTFQSRRSGGVRHPPEADIESIRELLTGYGSGSGILKELIQNAEDALSSRLDLLYLSGNIDSPFSLLRTPSLLVANNGPFTPEHHEAIFQINLGTKGTDDRTIGRFGKGLKSVFAWCEAFYIIARTDLSLGWKEDIFAELFNPWKDWRHQDWDAEIEAYWRVLASETEHRLRVIYEDGQPWLAFLFPLRARVQDPAQQWIASDASNFPGEDDEFYRLLGRELRSLAPSLVSLRNLERITIVDATSTDGAASVFEFPRSSPRIPATNGVPGPASRVDGGFVFRTFEGSETTYTYSGFGGCLPNERVAQLKAGRGWPLVVQRTGGQNSASRPVKGEPHFATTIAWSSVSRDLGSGSLDFRWCVFFPVGKQPPGTQVIPLSTIHAQITINLHGFFFLDSERLQIDGLDRRFDLNDASANKTCLEWNRLVATQGALAHLPSVMRPIEPVFGSIPASS